MAVLHGGRLVARALRRQGVTHAFTLCGGHIQAIYDGCLDEQIRVVDVRHEQTAGHAADGYARVSGTPGVALVTAGPGITNTVTALANAERAGIPLVCIGGAGPRALSHMGSLQDLDSVRLMLPVSKWAARIEETRRIEEFVATAFRIAQADCPGPTYLEIPLDVLMGMAEPEVAPNPARPPARSAGDPDAVEAAARLLEQASRPVFIMGSQIRWSPTPEAVLQAASKFRVPFFLNGMARGALPPKHPCLFAQVRREALKSSDAIFVFGTPFDFRLNYGRSETFPTEAKVVQVDLLGRELGRNRAIDVGIAGDSGLVLHALAAQASPHPDPEWLERLRKSEQERLSRIEAEIGRESLLPNPLRVCREVGKRLGPNDVVIGDGGDFVATAANVLSLSWPQLWMDPGPLGTLGIGPGYAMAAALLRPESRVVILYGDGSFGFHGMEFEALARQRIPVIAVVGNDAAWTQIRRGQVQLYGEQRSPATKLDYTRYDLAVEALGGRGFWVERSDQLERTLDQAFDGSGVTCVNVKLAPSDFRKGALSV